MIIFFLQAGWGGETARNHPAEPRVRHGRDDTAAVLEKPYGSGGTLRHPGRNMFVIIVVNLCAVWSGEQ